MTTSLGTNSNSNNNTGGGGGGGGQSSREESFVEVWAKNMDEQFDRIRHMVQKYPYVAMVSNIKRSVLPCDDIIVM